VPFSVQKVMSSVSSGKIWCIPMAGGRLFQACVAATGNARLLGVW